ncbi:hypothetical protein LTR62_001384 [Meristemomyces frigidus]|uniref:FAD-binding domain-containing protein n=1 Tax=Meristemomyces frigidus TaxID=1508187 RepID=A0AAN7T897_9PEZI|nr:hypothetical protein LTR62_001384 [Meristemomyces frigidus]
MAHSRAGITIIGAGISGLSLGRVLSKRGVPYAIFERDSIETAKKRHRYGITLEPKAYQPLLRYLNSDESIFRERLAVDGALKRSGVGGRPFRAKRQRLEALLSRDLNIKYDHKLESHSRTKGITILTFTNGQEVSSSLTVGADGVHSDLRTAIGIQAELKTIPYAVYRGKKLIIASEDRRAYDLLTEAVRQDGNVLQHRQGSAIFQIQVDDLTTTAADLTYTYSRSARRTSEDPLFKPHRPKSGARDLPPELFHEIAALNSGLKGIFAEIFDAEKMRKDRVINWLMRSISVEISELLSAAEGKGMVFLGDAVHAMPILGSYGANAGIEDAIALGEAIPDDGDYTKLDIPAFVRERSDLWRKLVGDGEQRLASMHTAQPPAQSEDSRSNL